MQWYVDVVTAHPILTAMVQFAILGTLGEMISKWIVAKRVYLPFSFGVTLWKMIVWTILSLGIKYSFVGTVGYLDALVNHTPHPMLPMIFAENHILRAIAISTLLNLQFGFFLIIFHRVLDNIIVKEKNWEGLNKGLLSLLWFWIPAHSVTFSLPKPYQIGLAALWSVVLGLILGSFNKKK